MRIKQRSRPAYDTTDLDHLRQTVNSRGWQMISERISDMLTTEAGTCSSTESLKAWRKAQGALAALNRVLKIPEILEREIRERMSKSKR